MSYWLMKSEPQEFSIDDLEACGAEGAGWVGVRNYQARNYLRQMQPGDAILFYHSSCPAPGIVGAMKILQSAFPDPTQFEEHNPYYDPRSSPEAPCWSAVRVGFVAKWPVMPLSMLRQMPELQDMALLQKGSRLSVTPVTQAEWQLLMCMAGTGPIEHHAGPR